MSEQMFVRRNRNVFLASDRGDEIPEIPAGVYSVAYHDQMGFFLRGEANIELPSKIYGTALPRADKILATFNDRKDRTSGVLLSGNKGSGKSLLAKVLCAKAVTEGKPVLIMQVPYAGPEFENFMNAITQACVVLIDEFEKKYDDENKQNALLSLLDGTGIGQKLYLMTSNSSQVSEFLLNRPSRIFYHMDYKKLEEELLEGYCMDNLQKPENYAKIRTLWTLSKDMSFDIMQSIVEEVNRWPDEDFVKLVDDMNISLADSLLLRYRLHKVLINGVEQRAGNHQTAHAHLVYFPDGETKVSTAWTFGELEEMFNFLKHVPRANVHFYCEEIFDKWKNGQEFDKDEFCGELALMLSYEDGNTFLTDQRLTFVRQYGPNKVEIQYKTMKQESDNLTVLNRIFSHLEEKGRV